MSTPQIPKKFLKLLKSITNKRARIVIDHILKHGQITTEELEKDYEYNHAPRAARDVREAGIPLKTIRVKSKDGTRNIAAYKFGDFNTLRKDRIKGRINWPKKFKENLITKYGQKCLISNAELEGRALQIDHRIPYEIIGDNKKKELDVGDFMLLSGTSNRAKSWSCEHCENWLKKKDIEICKTYYWAYPENYSHVAMNQIRRMDLIWQKAEIQEYEALKNESNEVGEPLPKYVKQILRRSIKKKN